jgi:hypothetical protein
MTTALGSLLGSTQGVNAFFDLEPPGGNTRADRDRLFGRVRAGDRIRTDAIEWCTASFGTWLRQETPRGESVFKHFLLTAGHCALQLNEEFFREAKNPNTSEFEYETLGKVRRQGIGISGVQVDGLAVLLQGEADAWAPRAIYLSPKSSQAVTGITVPAQGMIVSTSGVTSDEVLTGVVQGPPVPFRYEEIPSLTTYQVPIGIQEQQGDSGAPVWQTGTGNAIGLWNAGRNPSFVTTLVAYPGAEYPGFPALGNPSPGVLPTLGFEPGNLSFAR